MIQIEYVAPAKLAPAPYNPRKIDPSALKALERGITEFGLVDPIIARRSDGLVIGGHQRLKVAQKTGIKEVPVVYLDVTDQQAAALNVLLNNPKAQGDWDLPKLAEVLGDLDANGFDATLTGFDDKELERLLTYYKGLDGKTDPDDVPEPPAVPVAKLGDMYRLGNHRLLCGDATNPEHVKRLMDGKKADLMLTDPPYAIFGSSTGVGSDVADDKMVRPFFRDILNVALQNLRMFAHVYICCDWRSWPSWWEMARIVRLSPKNLIVWDKGGGLGANYTNTYELVGFFAVLPVQKYSSRRVSGKQRVVNGKPNLWRGGHVTDKLHHAQKPVELMEWLIGNSTEGGETILEPFAGSGTTIIAAERQLRHCLAIDIDPQWIDVCVQRWENFTGRKAEKVSEI